MPRLENVRSAVARSAVPPRPALPLPLAACCLSLPAVCLTAPGAELGVHQAAKPFEDQPALACHGYVACLIITSGMLRVPRGTPRLRAPGKFTESLMADSAWPSLLLTH